VGDDGRGPPVSHNGGGARGWASLGRKPGWPRSGERESGRRRRDRGARPDFERWAAPQNKKRDRKGFLFFLFLKINQTNEFKHTFEFKHSKQCINMYATINSYISLF
jgi:hypothetical protein